MVSLPERAQSVFPAGSNGEFNLPPPFQDIFHPAQTYRPQETARTDYAANNLNQYASVAGVVHDYDANGNLISDGANLYDYDAENRLAEVSTPAPLTATYSFDPLDRRVQQVAGGTVTQFLYSGAQEIAEYDGLGNLIRRFVPGAGFGEVAATVKATGERRYHHADALGSTVARSDDLGTIVERYAYGPYGEEAGAPGGTPFRFTGQRFDAETGLYHYRARAYSPALGRFLQPDPIGAEGGINLYAYVGNDPVNLTDPNGKCPWCIAVGIGAAAGALVEAGTQLIQNDFDFSKLDGTRIAIATAGGAAAGAGGFGVGQAAARLFTGGEAILANVVGNSAVGGVVNAGMQVSNNLTDNVTGNLASGVATAFNTGLVSGGIGGAVASPIERAITVSRFGGAPGSLNAAGKSIAEASINLIQAGADRLFSSALASPRGRGTSPRGRGTSPRGRGK